MSDWQPIETCPKDGRQVLATWAKTWDDGAPHIEVCYRSGRRWHYAYDGDAPSEDNPPTHWQPLPPAPPAVASRATDAQE